VVETAQHVQLESIIRHLIFLFIQQKLPCVLLVLLQTHILKQALLRVNQLRLFQQLAHLASICPARLAHRASIV
jgi:hypothetical protein